MNTIHLLFVIIILYLSPNLFSQKDSSYSEDEWKWHWAWQNWDDLEDWELDLGFHNTRPTISLQYGLAQINRKDLQAEFVDPNLLELKLGYIKEIKAWRTDYIIKDNYKYLYLSNESNQLSGKNPVGLEIESNIWSFGFGSSSGYGYKIGENSAVIPYNSYTLNWSNMDFKYPNILTFAPDADVNVLNLYDESFRFGTSSVGGVRIKVIDNLILDAGYERSIIFQRHLFWKWAGSAAIEGIAQDLLDGFINEVFESSPAAGPIVNFLLKNGLAYGMYELRQKKMNWPFKSEAPIAIDQFKFGVSVVF
jgi:hypothetical protein